MSSPCIWESLEPQPGIAWKEVMLGNSRKTFKPDSKYPTPEAAALALLRIYREHVTEEWPYTYTGKTNYAFAGGGGSLAEYRAGIEYGVEHGWFEIEAGSRVKVLAKD
jgi:hypothetical protein